MFSTDTATSGKPQPFSLRGRSRVHDGVRAALIASLIAAAGCGRTALEPVDPAVDAAQDRAIDAPPDRADAPADLAPDLSVERPRDVPPPPPDAPLCVPQSEVCNGVDDNCDGNIDEGQPAIPCPNGGSRFCVGGHYSDCPRRCEVCVPGSKRTCITSFCTFWGSQTCADDGMSFGMCKESTPPAACKDVANRMQRSRDLEQCCIDNGYCCVDEFDLDGDHDTTEMLGRCEAIVCQ